ncbi:rhamnogalacturonan endolyase family protein [Pseudarthrobacter raffinosi]|uniref:rhamnogalacturonan endolyase family protein n=1 Tax=Pseudarthrobacter raffinosi TaxID=2953651 RepID=UPI0027E24FD4|nr:hypothetical protein [Pseudarthrobacter sp. MDT3-28]
MSWRLLGHEATGSSATGLTGTDFNLYRDGQKLATVTDSTNYLDAAGTASSAYDVRAVVGGVELDRSATATSWGGNFKDIPRSATRATPTWTPTRPTARCSTGSTWASTSGPAPTTRRCW